MTTKTQTETKYAETSYGWHAQRDALRNLEDVISEGADGIPADAYSYSDRLNAAAAELASVGRGMKRTGHWWWVKDDLREAADDAARMFPRYVYLFSRILERVTRKDDRLSQRLADSALAEVARIAATDAEVFASMAPEPEDAEQERARRRRYDAVKSLRDLAKACDKANRRARTRDGRGSTI